MKFYLFSKRCMIKKIFLLLCVLKTYEFMTESERRQIIELIKREVIPAIGCTEPIAVALCVAKAAETLGIRPEKIEVLLSANILKNAIKISFSADQIRENAKEFIAMLNKLKPATAKGTYMKSIYLSSTMSPGIKIEPKSVDEI